MAQTVLIVEDEAALAGLLRDVLNSAGYEVAVTTAGQAARRTVELEPAAIVIDYLMPGLTGAQVVQQVREALPRTTPPIILVTGLANAGDLAAEVGADAYLRKPFDVDALIRLVRSLSAAHSG